MPIPQPQEPFIAAWQDLLQSQQQSDMGWLYLGVDDQGAQHAVEWRGSEPGEYLILSANCEQQRFRIAVDFSFHRSLLALIERQGLQQEPPGGPLQIQGQMALW
jgi:hypothetical protein